MVALGSPPYRAIMALADGLNRLTVDPSLDTRSAIERAVRALAEDCPDLAYSVHVSSRTLRVDCDASEAKVTMGSDHAESQEA